MIMLATDTLPGTVMLWHRLSSTAYESALDRQLVPTAGATGFEHAASTFGGHPCAKTVGALALDNARLVGALHVNVPFAHIIWWQKLHAF